MVEHGGRQVPLGGGENRLEPVSSGTKLRYRLTGHQRGQQRLDL